MAVQNKPIDESNIRVYDDLVPDYLQDFFELSILGRAGERTIHPTVPNIPRLGVATASISNNALG